eukprot:2403244-Amphidinium_carterae.1
MIRSIQRQLGSILILATKSHLVCPYSHAIWQWSMGAHLYAQDKDRSWRQRKQSALREMLSQ